jgi:ubiquinone/menaquinone biosynthesis C-methylase UbiE
VYGIEPSHERRSQAIQHESGPGIFFLEGSMERMPLEDDSYDAALLSYVLHHVEDKGLSASE